MGSRPFWNGSDLCVGVETLIRQHGGKVSLAVRALFGGSCSYARARELSVHLAHCFNMSEAQFMACYRRWRRGQSAL